VTAPSLMIRARDVLAAEWIKFSSVRSTYWTLGVAIVTGIAFSAIIAIAFANTPATSRVDPLLPSFLSLEYAVIAVAILGVLTVTGEYATGLIRTTFAAVPRRRPVLAAKATVVGLVALLVGEFVSLVSFLVVQAILATHHLNTSLSHPGVLRSVLATGALLCVCGTLGLGLGAITRHTVGALAAFIALVLAPWDHRIGRFSLFYAAQQAVASHPRTDLFSPGISVLILLAWPAAVLAAAAVRMTRQDT
jgi:ABC-2 type transport system permease protein